MRQSREKTSRPSKPCSKPSATEPAKPADPVSTVLGWVLSGATERQIKEAIAATFPEHDGEALIVSVFRDLEKSAAMSPDLIIGFCMEGSRELYRRMVEIGDFPGALRALKQLADLTRKSQKRPDTTKPANEDGEPSILSMVQGANAKRSAIAPTPSN